MQLAVASEQREELGIGNRTGNHLHLIVGGGTSEELDAVLVLIAPEERQRRIRLDRLTTTQRTILTHLDTPTTWPEQDPPTCGKRG